MFLILLTGLNRLKSGVSFCRLKPSLVTNRWTLSVKRTVSPPMTDRGMNARWSRVEAMPGKVATLRSA